LVLTVAIKTDIDISSGFCHEDNLSFPQQSQKQNSFLVVFAWIFAGLFVISSIGVIFSYFPTKKLLNPDYYKNALVNVGIYERLPKTIAQQLAANLSQGISGTDSPVYLLLLSQQEWESILSRLIDPAWLQTQTEAILDQFFDILLVSPDPLNTPINISIDELKNRLAGEEGIQAFNQILNAQPDCSLDQVMGLLQLGLGIETQIETLLCKPPDSIISELNPVVGSILSAVVAYIPDQVSSTLPTAMLQASTPGTPQELKPGELPGFIAALRSTHRLISWSPLLPILFLLLMTASAIRSLRDFLRWWGSAFLVGGGLSLIILLISFLTVDLSLGRLLPIPLSVYKLPPLLVQFGLLELSQELVNGILLSILVPAVILTILGILLLLGTYLLPKESPPDNVTERIELLSQFKKQDEDL
jgi:hypothetical protein